MSPADPRQVSWDTVAKVSISAIGAILIAVVGWAANAAEKQAAALEQLKTAVYSGQTNTAVLETKVEQIDTRVKKIEVKLFEEPKR